MQHPVSDRATLPQVLLEYAHPDLSDIVTFGQCKRKVGGIVTRTIIDNEDLGGAIGNRSQMVDRLF